MEPIEVFIPLADTRLSEYPLAERPTELSGLRIGWLSNSKANATELLRAADQAWRSSGVDTQSVELAKDATLAAPEAVMAQLKTCDAVVLAIAD